jgi:hypothetical protein
VCVCVCVCVEGRADACAMWFVCDLHLIYFDKEIEGYNTFVMVSSQLSQYGNSNVHVNSSVSTPTYMSSSVIELGLLLAS